MVCETSVRICPRSRPPSDGFRPPPPSPCPTRGDTTGASRGHTQPTNDTWPSEGASRHDDAKRSTSCTCVPRPPRRGGGDTTVSSLVIPCCGHPPATRNRVRPGACEGEVSCRGRVLWNVEGQTAPRVHEAATLTYSGLFHSVVPLHYDLASHGTFRLSPS